MKQSYLMYFIIFYYKDSRHVDHVRELILTKLTTHQRKHQLWVFINCKCNQSDKFFTTVLKIGIVENILQWVKFKAQEQLNKQGVKSKHSRVHVPKLEDANLAGEARSIDCSSSRLIFRYLFSKLIYRNFNYNLSH
uniref:DNA topoisomerase (ATP-hydrolyzing) n=1 Tax=Tetranychus urticae TaxID=32264 RepID=T1K873_TETUR